MMKEEQINMVKINQNELHTSSNFWSRDVLNCRTPRPDDVGSNLCALSNAWKRPVKQTIQSSQIRSFNLRVQGRTHVTFIACDFK